MDSNYPSGQLWITLSHVVTDPKVLPSSNLAARCALTLLSQTEKKCNIKAEGEGDLDTNGAWWGKVMRLTLPMVEDMSTDYVVDDTIIITCDVKVHEEDDNGVDDHDDAGGDRERFLKDGMRLTVSNNLEVSDVSSFTGLDLLRRHTSDANRWAHCVGIEIVVDEDDFRAIARSALAGRSCVLNDALCPKATAAFETSHAPNDIYTADDIAGQAAAGSKFVKAASTLDGDDSTFNEPPPLTGDNSRGKDSCSLTLAENCPPATDVSSDSFEMVESDDV
jgi:hypothetical protein